MASPRQLTATATAMDDADLVVLGRCGHWAQVERGVAFRGEVARFFVQEG